MPASPPPTLRWLECCVVASAGQSAAMCRVVYIPLVLLLCASVSSLSRQKRIVGGEPANPPPPNASEAEDVVENPALVAVQPMQPTRPTTARTTTRRPVANDDEGGPIVFLRRGRREARVAGSKEPEGIYAFKGIRYAQPPVDKLRFQRPRRLKMEGDIEAKKPGPPCPQTIGQRIIGSEDCLFLNVYSPELPSEGESKKYPVMFWIHGGGFRRGSGSQYGVADLVKKGLVVVTIQYRLGSLGFLSTNRKELPGNAGLFDIAASLRWVRHYIEPFGGDPDRIIPSGQGSGGSAAIMLTLAHFTKSWIKGVFAMSGTAISSFAVDKEPEKTATDVAAFDSCQEVKDPLPFIRCMQKLPLETLVGGDDKLQDSRLAKDNSGAESYITSISKLLNPGPAVEGGDDFRFLPNFLTGTPLEILQKGDFAKVPLLTGVTKDETSTSAKGGGLASKLLGGVEATEELLEQMIPQLLQANTGILGNTSLNPVIDKLFSNNAYLKGVTSSLNGVASGLDKIIEVYYGALLGNTNPLLEKLFPNNVYMNGVTSTLNGVATELDKIIEMTTDALFNLPAFLTSKLWASQNKAYLYSFEHESQTTAADDFLQDSPLTEQAENTSVEGVGHGDDLEYLFDVRSVEGETVDSPGLTDDNDKQVREHFTDMVAEFCRSGVPKINGQTVKPFSSNSGNYVKVDKTPSIAQGFRKCQMGLWAGLTDVLKSAECSFLNLGDVINSLGLATKGVTDTLTNPGGALTNSTNDLTGGLGGLLGGGQKGKPNQAGGLGGLLGGGTSQGTPTQSGGLGGLLGGGKGQSTTRKPSGSLLGFG